MAVASPKAPPSTASDVGARQVRPALAAQPARAQEAHVVPDLADLAAERLPGREAPDEGLRGRGRREVPGPPAGEDRAAGRRHRCPDAQRREPHPHAAGGPRALGVHERHRHVPVGQALDDHRVAAPQRDHRHRDRALLLLVAAEERTRLEPRRLRLSRRADAARHQADAVPHRPRHRASERRERAAERQRAGQEHGEDRQEGDVLQGGLAARGVRRGRCRGGGRSVARRGHAPSRAGRRKFAPAVQSGV